MPEDRGVSETLVLMTRLRQRIADLESECGHHAELREAVQAMKHSVEDLIAELKWFQLLNDR